MKAILLFLGLGLLPIVGCSSKPAVSLINQEASLTGALPYNPLQWKVITSSVNRPSSTMSTLYGNDIAVQYARTNPEHNYPAGSVLSLVTWSQREDPHWFGARIPGAVKSVEFVTASAAYNQKPIYAYERYQDAPLKKVALTDKDAMNERMNHLLAERAAVMP